MITIKSEKGQFYLSGLRQAVDAECEAGRCQPDGLARQLEDLDSLCAMGQVSSLEEYFQAHRVFP